MKRMGDCPDCNSVILGVEVEGIHLPFHMTENINDIKTFGTQKVIFTCDLHAEITHCFLMHFKL